MSPDKAILVVDDIPDFLREVRQILRPVSRRVTVCSSPLRALRLLRRRPFDLVITTLVMRELGGFDLVRRLRGQGCGAPVVMITGFGGPETAIEATRIGVSDYLEKPVRPEELRARILKVLRQAEAPGVAQGATDQAQFVSADPAMRAILDMVGAVARSDSRVLILGETGTGKQLIAQAIHHASPRRDEPFVEVNCAAIPENLLESELFGHERGAFTGAAERRVGRFEEAGQGTLFLDEIGEMGIGLQAKLLRVLQNGRFNRVGGSETLQSRARVIAATNRDLQQEVAAGRFRADLFYRLHVISLTLPPLRRRTVDVPLLADFFLRRFRGDRPVPAGFTPEALQLLQAHDWPGNVRELEHLVERLAVLSEKPLLGPEDLPEKLRAAPPPAAPAAATVAPDGALLPYADAWRIFERGYLEQTLARARGNMAAAARLARVDRSHYFRLVRRHGIDPARFA